MIPRNYIYKESIWVTSLNSDYRNLNVDYTKPIIGHRSLVLNLLTLAMAILISLLLVYFLFSKNYEFSFLYIFCLIGALAFLFFSVKALFCQSREIKIDYEGITFDKNETIKWHDIKKTFIRRRCYYFTRGNEPTIERFYLDIETVFSGVYTKHTGIRSYEITGLTLSEIEIEQYIQLFKTKYTT